MKSHTYRVIIEPDENNTFHAYVPALPGCHTFGHSIDEARAMVRDAISGYIESLILNNEPVPEDLGMEIFETVPYSIPKNTVMV